MLPHLLIPAIVAPLLALAIWRRVRSQFGRQPIRRGRMVLRIGIFAVLGVVLAASGLHSPHLLEGLLGGALAGAALGLLGLRLTRFERDPLRGDCYVPNPWIGGLLTALLLGRLAWRFAQLLPQSEDGVIAAQGAAAHAPALGDSPLTLLLIGLLIGYYLVYFAGLLVHHRRYLDRQPAAPPT